MDTVQAIDGSALGACVALTAPTDLSTWAREHGARVRALVAERGFVLLRGFAVASTTEFRSFVTQLIGDHMSYLDASTPRTLVETGVYTATEYPPEQRIVLHNEHSYSAVVPRYLSFYCQTPAASGGETILADSALVYDSISPSTRQLLEQDGVRYVRNFYEWLSPTWQVSFGTDDRAEAGRFCDQHGIAYAWRDDVLHTEQRRPASIVHPESGHVVWFNQAHLFHISALDAEIRETYQELFELDAYPRNALLGSGRPIPDDVVEEISAAYEAATIRLALDPGDVVILDNIRVAHGREAFQGKREMFVFMSSPWSVDR